LTKSKLDKGFIPLDNTENLRPDWAEYWPIRNVLLNQNFNSNDYIGFLSSKFYEKTWCSSEVVLDTIASRKHDFYSISPYFDQMALYLNSFEQGESYHPGIKNLTNAFLRQIGIDYDVSNFVSDVSTCIYCNYFVAKYEFWKIWLEYAEQLFQIVENKESDLGRLFTNFTEYREKNDIFHMKVFLLERLVSLVLKFQNLSAFHILDVRKAPFDLHNVSNFLGDLLTCDALKGQYLKTNSLCYLQEFAKVRNKVFSNLKSIAQNKTNSGVINAP
ncbi:MAG: hypothetical protein DWH70_04865, partial [Planctomycetota bacterium]